MCRQWLTHTHTHSHKHAHALTHSHTNLFKPHAWNYIALNTLNYPSIIREWLSTNRKNCDSLLWLRVPAGWLAGMYDCVCWRANVYLLLLFLFKFRLSEQFNVQSTHNWIWLLLPVVVVGSGLFCSSCIFMYQKPNWRAQIYFRSFH